jgi:hypothetical protein
VRLCCGPAKDSFALTWTLPVVRALLASRQRLLDLAALVGANRLCQASFPRFAVHYNVLGSGRDITVSAQSSAEARRVVMEMIPGAVVTGVHRIKQHPRRTDKFFSRERHLLNFSRFLTGRLAFPIHLQELDALGQPLLSSRLLVHDRVQPQNGRRSLAES